MRQRGSAAARLLLFALSRGVLDLDASAPLRCGCIVICSQRLLGDYVVDLSQDALEGRLYICGLQRRCLDEGQVLLFAVGLHTMASKGSLSFSLTQALVVRAKGRCQHKGHQWSQTMTAMHDLDCQDMAGDAYMRANPHLSRTGRHNRYRICHNTSTAQAWPLQLWTHTESGTRYGSRQEPDWQPGLRSFIS